MDNNLRQNNTELIVDIPVKVSVSLGSARKTIAEITSLNMGSVVILDSCPDDLVNIMVNGKLVARGSLVVVGDNYGVRIVNMVR